VRLEPDQFSRAARTGPACWRSAANRPKPSTTSPA
jgi:hypothetical protein